MTTGKIWPEAHNEFIRYEKRANIGGGEHSANFKTLNFTLFQKLSLKKCLRAKFLSFG